MTVQVVESIALGLTPINQCGKPNRTTPAKIPLMQNSRSDYAEVYRLSVCDLIDVIKGLSVYCGVQDRNKPEILSISQFTEVSITPDHLTSCAHHSRMYFM